MKTDNKKKRWYHDYIEWKFEKRLIVDPFNVVMTMLMLGIAAGFLLLSMDGVGSYRAQSATFACEARQMQARRYTFTDSVLCVPYPTRRDTTTVEVPRGE
jgi:hypothetical protein